MSLYGNSQLTNSNLTFIGNHAVNEGGGISKKSRGYEILCNIISIPNTTNVSFYFINNTAAVGDDIYGIAFGNRYCQHSDMSIFKTQICNTSSDCACICTMTIAHKLCQGCTYSQDIIINFNISLLDTIKNITAGSISRYLNDTYIDTIHIGSIKCTEISYTATVNSSTSNYNLNIYPLTSFYTIKVTIPFSIYWLY